MFTSSEDELTV